MYSIRAKVLRKLPSACPLCGLSARGGDLCAGCMQDFVGCVRSQPRCDVCLDPLRVSTVHTQRLPEVHCARCREVAPPYFRLIAAIDYAYPGDLLIQRFKEGGHLAYAGLFARLIWGAWQTCERARLHTPSLGALVPIPASQQALGRRGFNPAGELARELAGLSGCALKREWLTRTRESTHQKTLDLAGRRQSVQGLYACKYVLPGIWVGLVDDVVTTGSTMRTAALALRHAGAAGVVALAAAHTPRAWQNGAYD